MWCILSDPYRHGMEPRKRPPCGERPVKLRFQRPPCAKGAPAERVGDCAVLTTPPSWLRHATSPCTGEALGEVRPPCGELRSNSGGMGDCAVLTTLPSAMLTPPRHLLRSCTQGRLENEKVPLVQRGMASRSEARGIVLRTTPPSADAATSPCTGEALDKIID